MSRFCYKIICSILSRTCTDIVNVFELITYYLCYTNIYSTVINNGFSSGWFRISRGVRQGCPLSCVLFVLCVELLAHLIRENNDIHGIQIGGDGIKLSQFADDIFSFVSNESSIKACDKFTIVSGLKLNKEKSQIIWLGPWKNKIKAPCGTAINKHSVHVLGISIPRNPESYDALNIDSCIEKMKKAI